MITARADWATHRPGEVDGRDRAEGASGSGWFGSSPLSITIFTGTRWTILTKLPVAFSGRKAREARAQCPSWMLSTWPFSRRWG